MVPTLISTHFYPTKHYSIYLALRAMIILGHAHKELHSNWSASAYVGVRLTSCTRTMQGHQQVTFDEEFMAITVE